MNFYVITRYTMMAAWRLGPQQRHKTEQNRKRRPTFKHSGTARASGIVHHCNGRAHAVLAASTSRPPPKNENSLPAEEGVHIAQLPPTAPAPQYCEPPLAAKNGTMDLKQYLL